MAELNDVLKQLNNNKNEDFMKNGISVFFFGTIFGIFITMLLMLFGFVVISKQPVTSLIYNQITADTTARTEQGGLKIDQSAKGVEYLGADDWNNMVRGQDAK